MIATIFKAYDIRGRSPGELDAQTARRIGKSLASIYQPKRVLVGHDMRMTSESLESALIDGLVASGVDVVKIGLCSTPMFNFAVGEASGSYDLGVMVTASHNPAEYNGFKMDRSDCLPIGHGTGMERIRDLALSERALLDAPKRGNVTSDEEVLTRYVARVVELAGLPLPLPRWRIAVDAGNGMDGIVLPRLGKQLPGIDLIPLYWDPDGRFPNHEANPLKVETLKALQARVLRDECLFGVAFDGDGDRVGFVDEKGEPIPGDVLTALFAQELLRGHAGGKVLYDLRSSWSTPEAIREAGGEPIMCRVGHAHIKKQMRETGAIFGGELSMHFYFASLWSCESGDLAMLLMIKLLIRTGKPLSSLWKPLRRYAHSGEINFEVKDAKAVMAKLEERYASRASDVSYLDGLRLEFRSPDASEKDWWFSVRSSNTEPLLRLNLEARSVEEMKEKKKELTREITT